MPLQLDLNLYCIPLYSRRYTNRQARDVAVTRGFRPADIVILSLGNTGMVNHDRDKISESEFFVAHDSVGLSRLKLVPWQR